MVYKIVSFLIVIVIFASCTNSDKTKTDSFEKAISANDSIVLLTNQIKKDSTDFNLWKKRATLYLNQGNVDFAFRDVNKALQLNSEDPEIFIILSDLYFTIGKIDNSLSSIKKAIDLRPDNPASYLKMARVKMILQQYKSASLFSDKVISLSPNSSEAYYIKAISALEQKDSTNALNFMKIAANIDTNFFAANLNIAVILSGRGDTTAKVYYEKALKIKPDNMLALYSFGMFYQNHKQYNRALTTYNKLIKSHPDNAEAHFNMGYIYLTEFLKFEKAEKEFEQAIEIKPDYTEAVYNLGRTYEVMGKTDQAKKKYREALKLTTNYPLAIEGLNRLE